MDVAYFLRQRTRFIRYYYATGVQPFREIQRKITDEESPYDVPPRYFDPEDGEPAYIEEWGEANDAAQIVGQSAVALLSDSLKLYFKALEAEFRFSLDENELRVAKREGFIAAYRLALGELFETDWSDCPPNFKVIEQVVLARNRAQHGESLTILGARHDAKTLTKHPDLIFASEGERKMWIETGADPETWMPPRLEITPENLTAAIDETERLVDWIEERMPVALARRYAEHRERVRSADE